VLIAKVGRELLSGFRNRRPIERGVRILVYHGVVERRVDARVEENFHLLADFRAHLALLRRCPVVSLEELDEPSSASRMMPLSAITFDDGFANNLLAAELLYEAKLPATVFIASENVDRQQAPWPTLLRLILARGSARVVRLTDTVYDLDRDPNAFSRVRAVFKEVPAEKRLALWDELVSQLGTGEVDELVRAFPSISMLTWRDVRSLQAAGITIGSHGCLHELHHTAQARDLRIQELTASKAQIEMATGHQCNSFAFPNGTFHPHSPDEVRSSGYLRGFTMVPHPARPTDDPMLLPRIGSPAALEKLIATLVFGN
jgi:peptidoglycan/xylan/chitin deacetylase (PgdA/CDA1 family)